jgi:tetratricopeptide (TPR) repeat protein
MRMSFPILLGLAVAVSSVAAKGDAFSGKEGYARCVDLVRNDPHEAVSAAETWHNNGGGAAALHCEALGLTALHRYAEAAVKLDQAALIAPGDIRVALYDQAGNAWLLAGNPDRAETSIDSALALSPHDEDILFDRARARAARKNWSGAEQDLSLLLQLDSNRADAWVLRASARHAEGRKAEANADIARALAVYPDYPEALVERGAMKLEAGDVNGARADWQAVLHNAPNGDAAAAARDHLAAMTAPAPQKPQKPQKPNGK